MSLVFDDNKNFGTCTQQYAIPPQALVNKEICDAAGCLFKNSTA